MISSVFDSPSLMFGIVSVASRIAPPLAQRRPFTAVGALAGLRPLAWTAACALVALLAGGCSLIGSDTDVDGQYSFANAFGYVETIVVQPDGFDELRFEFEGTVTLEAVNGQLSGTGTCTRTTTRTSQPGGEQEQTVVTDNVTVSGDKSGAKLTNVRMTGCAFPRPMFGTVDDGRIVLDTDLDFPVSRGTTVISDRFGDPTRLVLTSSDR